ncbi:MAG: PAS domain S-box protein [bacterium]|nr:PAS domain S-box protein [bacterium]
MSKISQNNKIAISVLAIFMVSFSIMLFFLGDTGGIDYKKADVLDSGAHSSVEESVSDKDLGAIFSAHLENTSDPSFLTDAKGKIEFASDSFCKILGSKCKRVIGEKLFNYINPEDLEAFVDDYTTLVQGDEQTHSMGPYRIRKNVTEVLLLLSAELVLDENNKISGILFSVRDLTEQVDALQSDSDQKDDAPVQPKEQDSWIKNLYPKIDEIENNSPQLIVDKITYADKD